MSEDINELGERINKDKQVFYHRHLKKLDFYELKKDKIKQLRMQIVVRLLFP